MLRNKMWLGIILSIILLAFSVNGFTAYYKYTQESGAKFYVGTGDKADALEDTNEMRQILDDLGDLLGHSKRDDSYPEDGTTGGYLSVFTNIVYCNNYDNPDDAITAIASANKTLLVTEAETCDTNFTVPANVMVKFERGGKWTINNGIMVTFNGSLQAGLWQIFEYVGTGTLDGTPVVNWVYPQWWSGDIGTQINTAISSGFLHIFVPPGTYEQTTKITITTNGVHLWSVGTGIRGNSGAIIKKQSDIVSLEVTAYIDIRGIDFDGEDFADSSAGVILHGKSVFMGKSSNHGGNGLELTVTSALHNVNGCIIEGTFSGNGDSGIHIEDSNAPATPDTNIIQIRYVICRENTDAGLKLLTGQYCRISGQFDLNDYGIYVDDDSGNSGVAKNHFDIYCESNTTKDTYFATTDSENLIEGRLGTKTISTDNMVWISPRTIEGSANDTKLVLLNLRNTFDTGDNEGSGIRFVQDDDTRHSYIYGLGNGDLELVPGSLSNKVVLVKGQLAFPATQNPSANVNALDDYKEGTWTAVIEGADTAGTYEIDSQYSNYTKIGRVIHLESRIILAGVVTGGGAGNLNITGCPFTKMANSRPIGSVTVFDVDFTGTYLNSCFVGDTASSILMVMQTRDNDSFIALPVTTVVADSRIYFSITFFE